MSFARSHNIGAFIGNERASDNVAVTAGGAGDNTEVVGQIIDTTLFKHPLSVAVLINWKAVLGVSKTLTVKTVKLEHGDNSGLSDAANLATPADVVVATDSGSGSTLRGSQKYSSDLAGAKRYLRLKYTPDLSNTVTDTAELGACFVFGGQDELS